MDEPTKSTCYFTRSSAPLVLEGVRAPTLASLRQQLILHGIPDSLVVSDLSLGAAKAHQIALEFNQQLGLDHTPKPQQSLGARSDMSGPPSYAALMGAWIDTEAGGDLTIAQSLENATRLVNAIRTSSPLLFLVITPLEGCFWESENIQFLRFLVQGLQETQHRLLLVSTEYEQPSLPPDWIVKWSDAPQVDSRVESAGLLALVPGIIQSEIVNLIGAAAFDPRDLFLSLANGQLLIALECRRSPSSFSKFEYDRLAAAASSMKWLKAYAQFYGNNLYADPALLVEEASRLISEGGYGIALKYLERAMTCTRALVPRATYESQAQGLRIALHRFKEIVKGSDPSQALPRELRGALLQAKGWGLVMSEQPLRGLDYLTQAGELLRPHYGNRFEYLYFMNIFALAKLKSGDIQGAFALEKEIEDLLDHQDFIDWRLKYVNSINIARLKRRMADLEGAEQYFQQAFSTIAAGESDLIYRNVCLARLHADRGRHLEAFNCWFRAGLHWVSSLTPEALAPRVVASIVRDVSIEDNSVENVSFCLTSSILEYAAAVRSDLPARLSHDPDSDNLAVPTFLPTHAIPKAVGGTFSCLVGHPGWSVLLVNQEAAPPFNGPHSNHLRVLILTMLKNLTPATDFAGAKAIAIDNCFGHEIPASALEMLQTCVRLSVPKMIYNGEVYNLTPECHEMLEMESRVRISAAVDRIDINDDGATLYFKRYLSRQHLTREESRILTLLDDAPTIKEISRRTNANQMPPDPLRSLRLLEKRQIVTFYLTEQAAILCGLRLPLGDSPGP